MLWSDLRKERKNCFILAQQSFKVPIHPSAKVTVCWFITEHPRLSLHWKLGRFSLIVSRVYRWQHVTTINIFFCLTWEVEDITMNHCFSCQTNQQMQQAQEIPNLLIPKTAKLSWCFSSIRCRWGTWKHQALPINTWNGLSHATPAKSIWEINTCLSFQVCAIISLSFLQCFSHHSQTAERWNHRTHHTCQNKELLSSASADHN